MKEETRRRQEEEELARVLELSKQDKGGRQQPTTNGSSSSQVPAYIAAASQPRQSSVSNPVQPAIPAYTPPEPEPVLDLNTATRVRALYTFSTVEVGELNFERGDVIKVLDRGFKEWWRGACNGKIGVSFSFFGRTVDCNKS